MEGLYFALKEHEEFYKHMLRQSGRRAGKRGCALMNCFAPYYMESVKLRHPEQFRTELKRGQEKVWYR